jgi:uncharacterized protein YecT (DUF1311 family)
MRAWLVLLAVLGLVPGAAAQQRDSGEAPLTGLVVVLEGCAVDARRDRAKEFACIGLHAVRCLARPGNDTTMAMARCWQDEAAAWDILLNRWWRERPQGPRGEALRDVQRSWIAWRDARCGYFDTFRQGGTMARIEAAQCMAEETALRAMELRGFRRDPS